MNKQSIAPAAGRLGVLLPGLGAVATTYMAGIPDQERSSDWGSIHHYGFYLPVITAER